MATKKKLAIAGATGFIGRWFIETYKDDFDIVALSRKSIEETDSKVEWRTVDLFSISSSKKALEGVHYALYLVHSMQPSTRLDQSNFEAFIASTNGSVLVDFWAPWCGPCKAIAPILEELATELSDTVKIGKVNVDNNSELASKYEVRAIPTIKIFKDGQVADTVVGLSSKEDLTSRLS